MRYALLTILIIAIPVMSQVNPFENRGAAATVSAIHIQNVTPSDTCDGQFSVVPRAVWVGGEGNLSVTTYGGETVVIQGIQAGTLLPIVVECIRATSTTATLIQIWW